MITANLNTLADSLRMWTSPAMKSVYEAAKHQTNADVVGNWIGVIILTLLCVALIIYAVLYRKSIIKEDGSLDSDEKGWFGFMLVLSIVSIATSLAFIIPLINIYIAPKYHTIENIMSLVQKMRGQ